LAAHPTQNYIATGYDTGLTVFKVERERVPSISINNVSFYVFNKNLYFYTTTGEKTLLTQTYNSGKQALMNQPSQLYYNHFNTSGHDLIMYFKGETPYFLIYQIDKNLAAKKIISEKKGDGVSGAVFISKDKICVLDKSGDLYLCSYDGSQRKEIPWVNGETIDKIFPANLGKVIVHTTDNNLYLFDVSLKKIVHSMQSSDIRDIHWNANYS
jgi:hypothetical protein